TLSSAAGTTNPATGQPNATFAPLDIGARGLCDSSPLVFDPIIQASFQVSGPLGSGQLGIDFGDQNTCTGPKDPFEGMNTVGPRSITGQIAAIENFAIHYYFAP